MNDEQFEAVLDFIRRNWNSGGSPVSDLQARDTTQREALARVEAERDHWIANYNHLIEQHMPRTGHGCDEGWSRVVDARECQAQLAEAVILIGQIQDCRSFDDVKVISRFLAEFLARYAQVDQQEAQGAQAEPANFGQELEAFEKWRHTQADSLRRCGYPDAADKFIQLGSVQWAGWQARAALATQSVTGEPQPKYRERSNHVVLRQGDWQPCYCWAENDHRIGQEVAAPPAAAHGDEAVRKLPETMKQNAKGSDTEWWYAEGWNACLAAMRAQAGEGGEV